MFNGVYLRNNLPKIKDGLMKQILMSLNNRNSLDNFL